LQRNVAQMSARGLAQLQSLDEKRRDGASFGQVWEALLTPSRQTSRAKLTDPL